MYINAMIYITTMWWDGYWHTGGIGARAENC